MKRLLTALAGLAIALSALVPATADAANNPRSFTQTLNTTTKTSDALDTNTNGTGVGFTVAVTGTFSANWRLQRSVDNGSTWVDFFVIDQADALCVSAQAPALWRLSAAGGGDFTSGSAAVSFVKGGGDCTTPVTRLMTKDRAAVSSANPLPVTGTVSSSNVPATGQTTMSGSLPVAIASNQSAVSTTVSSALPAGSNIVGKIGIDQTTPGTTNGVQVNAALPAGSNLIGQVTTPQNIRVTSAQTVTAALYATGNAVGGKITFSNAVRVAAQGGIIQTCIVRDKAGQNVPYDLILFDADPTNTTVTDKSAVAVNTADLAKVIGAVSLSGAVLGAASTMGVTTAAGLGLSFKLGSGTTMYGILVTRGAPTYASTSDVSVDCVILPD